MIVLITTKIKHVWQVITCIIYSNTSFDKKKKQQIESPLKCTQTLYLKPEIRQPIS